MKKRANQAIGAFFLAGAIAVTGIAVTLPAGASTTAAKSSAVKTQESLPANVQASLQKLIETEPMLKQMKMSGYSKQPLTNDGQIRGVWTVVLKKQDPQTSKVNMSAEVQFDSITGELRNYVSYVSPEFFAEAKSQNEAFYREKMSAFLNQLFGDEYAKQLEKKAEFSIEKRSGNKVERQVCTANFYSNVEKVQVSMDTAGQLVDFNRAPLPINKK